MNQKYIGKTCPYCQFPIKNEKDCLICPECKIPHHIECWKENQGCTTFACSGKSIEKHFFSDHCYDEELGNKSLRSFRAEKEKQFNERKINERDRKLTEAIKEAKIKNLRRWITISLIAFIIIYVGFGIGTYSILLFNNGIYIGEVNFFKPNGKGTAFYKNGDKYVGEWSDWDRHGYGTYYWDESGNTYEGRWINDEKSRILRRM